MKTTADSAQIPHLEFGKREEGSCESCDAFPAVYITMQNFTAAYCPRCTQDYMTFNTSGNHLRELLTDAIDDWLDIWSEAPVYKREWDELYSQLTDGLDFDALVMSILTRRKILPNTSRRGGKK